MKSFLLLFLVWSSGRAERAEYKSKKGKQQQSLEIRDVASMQKKSCLTQHQRLLAVVAGQVSADKVTTPAGLDLEKILRLENDIAAMEKLPNQQPNPVMDNVRHLSMFMKHLRDRCRDLTLDATCKLDDQGWTDLDNGRCWQADGENQENYEIYFGQQQVDCKFGDTPGPGFFGHHNGNDIQPQITNQPIFEVASKLSAGTLPRDAIPVVVSFSANNNRWFAINNRGFTTNRLAGIYPPLRIIPQLWSQITPQARLRNWYARFNWVEAQNYCGWAGNQVTRQNNVLTLPGAFATLCTSDLNDPEWRNHPTRLCKVQLPGQR